MKNLILLFTFGLATHSAHANDLRLTCTVTHNSEAVILTTVTLLPKARNLKFGEYQQFRFFLSDNSNNESTATELQIYDGGSPSRTYAVSDMSKSKKIELSIWTQDYLLTAECSR